MTDHETPPGEGQESDRAQDASPQPSDDEQKRIALEYLLDAWDRALESGVRPEVLATTAVFAALTDMVDIHGQDAVAEMMVDLPDRIRGGEFTLKQEDGSEPTTE